MRAAAIRLLGAVLVALLAAGCAQIEGRDRALKLDQAVNAYLASLRWGEIGQAARFVRGRDGALAAVEPGRYRGLKVTGYRVETVPVAAGEVLMTARFSYYREDSASVHELEHRGLWWYDEQSQGWFMEGALPRF